MRVTVFGTGYVGLVTGTCLAEVGNQVVCVDIDQAKVDGLNQGVIPIYEPGLEEMVLANHASGRLSFTTEVAAPIEHGDIIFIAVGTPPDEDGGADLQYVLAVARTIGRHLKRPAVVVNKSTVPVGTADKVRAAIAAELKARGSDVAYEVVSNPDRRRLSRAPLRGARRDRRSRRRAARSRRPDQGQRLPARRMPPARAPDRAHGGCGGRDRRRSTRAIRVCASGYYHGVTEAAMTKIGAGGGRASAPAVCAAVRKRPHSATRQCIHGMGHGFMGVLDRDLGASLKGCDALRGVARAARLLQRRLHGEPRGGRQARPRLAAPGRAAVSLHRGRRRYREECYDRQSTYALFVSDGDFDAVFQLCAQDRARLPRRLPPRPRR